MIGARGSRSGRRDECRPLWGLAALLILTSACAPAPRPHDEAIDLVLALAPAGSPTATGPLVSPGVRYPRGSRVVVSEYGGTLRLLSEGFEAAGAPALSPAGDEVLFTARRPQDRRWHIWRVGLRGGSPVAVSDPALDCVEPAFLAGGRIVFSCAVRADGSPNWSLYTVSGTGTGLERVTFGPGDARAPTALGDGRILFVMGRIGAPKMPGMFTVNPDGTLLESFVDVRPGGQVPLQIRQGVDGSVLVLFLTPGGSPRAERLDYGAPMVPAQIIRPPAAAAAVGLVALETAGGGAALLAYSSPGEHSVAYLQGEAGWLKIWESAGDERIVEVVAVRSRPAPRGRPRNVDLERTVGYLLGYDAGRSDGSVDPSLGSPAPARVQIDTMRAGAVHRSRGGVSSLDSDPFTSLGEAGVHDDGSFFVEVPADTPLRITTLDSNGNRMRQSGWFWVRPGEVRACFGCHESRSAAPVNAIVSAISADAVLLRPTAMGAVSSAASSGGDR